MDFGGYTWTRLENVVFVCQWTKESEKLSCSSAPSHKSLTRNVARCTRNHIPVTIPIVMSRRKRKNLRILFGERVRSLRLSKKLSQEALSERAGISVDFLSLIERGRNSPSFDKMQSLADALNVPVARLFTFDKDSE